MKTAFFTLKTSSILLLSSVQNTDSDKERRPPRKTKETKITELQLFKVRKEDQFNKLQPPPSSLSKTIEPCNDFYIFAWVLHFILFAHRQ